MVTEYVGQLIRGMIRTENANIRESITVGLTSCFVCLNSAALLKLNEQQFNLFQRTLTVGGSITVRLVSSFTRLH